jgi:hypothetical protein
MAKMVCFKSKAKAKSAAKHRRAGGKRAHVKEKKGSFCVVGGKARKSRRSKH